MVLGKQGRCLNDTVARNEARYPFKDASGFATGECLTDLLERRLGHLGSLFQDLNAISVIAFLPLFIYIAATLGSALDGTDMKLLYAFPFLAFMVAYWYWRYSHLSARCKEHRHAKNVLEYERTVKYDSLRTVIVGTVIITTVFFILFEEKSIAVFAAFFIGGLIVYLILVGLTTISYWVSAWLDTRRAGD